MIHLGIVGIGGYGWTLVRAIQQSQRQCDCRLVAAADALLPSMPERARWLRQRGVRLFEDGQEMFDAMKGRCDAVYIATGISSHAELTVAAAEAGYHVHLEKPPAATVQEVDRMIEALDRAGRMCMVGFQAVHSRDLLAVKERIVSGRLGKVRSLACYACWPRTARYYSRNDWAGKLRDGQTWILDGPATNALAHQINNMLFWSSPKANDFATPTAVRAEMYAAGPVESHNTAAIELATAEGPRIHFLASHATERYARVKIEVEAERGKVTWRMQQGAEIEYADGSTESIPYESEHHSNMVCNLVEAIRAGDPQHLREPLRQARKVVLVLNGAHESAGRIHRIEGPNVQTIDEGTDHERTVVAGLDDLLQRAADERCLLSDLNGSADWAVPTSWFDLSGYREFPRQFAIS